MKVAVKVVPGASRDAIAGWLGEVLKVRVSAPPEKGRANKAVEELLATRLNLPSRRVKVVSGMTSPHKVVEIEDLPDVDLRALLGSGDH